MLSRNTLRYFIDQDETFERTSATWRSMYLSSPPLTKLNVIHDMMSFGNLGLLVDNQHGVTMDDIYHCIYNFIRDEKERSRPKAAFYEILAGMVRSTILEPDGFECHLEFWPLTRHPK